MPPFPYALKIADLVWLPTAYPLTEKCFSRPSTPTLILDSRTRIRSILLGSSNSRDHKVTVAPDTYLSQRQIKACISLFELPGQKVHFYKTNPTQPDWSTTVHRLNLYLTLTPNQSHLVSALMRPPCQPLSRPRQGGGLAICKQKQEGTVGRTFRSASPTAARLPTLQAGLQRLMLDALTRCDGLVLAGISHGK